jgi:hypothetical protein
MDPDPDPAIFVLDLEDDKKKVFSKFFFLLLFEAQNHTDPDPQHCSKVTQILLKK